MVSIFSPPISPVVLIFYLRENELERLIDCVLLNTGHLFKEREIKYLLLLCYFIKGNVICGMNMIMCGVCLKCFSNLSDI